MSVRDVSPNTLRKETIAVVKSIDAVVENIEEVARERGCAPEELRDMNGNWILSPLLVARAQCINTLTLLRGQ